MGVPHLQIQESEQRKCACFPFDSEKQPQHSLWGFNSGKYQYTSFRHLEGPLWIEHAIESVILLQVVKWKRKPPPQGKLSFMQSQNTAGSGILNCIMSNWQARLFEPFSPNSSRVKITLPKMGMSPREFADLYGLAFNFHRHSVSSKPLVAF